MNENNNSNNNRNNRGSNGILQTIFGILISLVFIYFINFMLSGFLTNNLMGELTYDEFIQKIESGDVEKVEIADSLIVYTKQTKELPKLEDVDSSNLNAYLGSITNKYQVQKLESNAELVKRLLDKGNIKIIGVRESILQELFISWVLPFLFLMLLFNLLTRRMGGGLPGISGVGRSTAKMYMQKETGVTFKDVAGEDEAIESLTEIVDFLHNPGKYTGVGAKLPKGALLVGPPGTGKTLLAKAVAGEAKVPFFSLTGSDFVEMYAGVGASRVRDLFKQAQAAAPCIVFIDEIDAIGRSRDARAISGADGEREQTLNQLLSEMDGFATNKGIMILAATNRPEVLDPALLRPGRFDRRIIVDKPDLKGRVSILKVHAKDVKLSDDVDFDEIALNTSGAVGADLANMINEAAINAAKRSQQSVSQKDLFDAVEVVLVGKEKKDRVLSKEERKIVSYHEIGHALVSALQKHSEPVQKITIVPRTMGALGYVMQTPEEEKFLNTKKELEARLVTSLAGRAAEEIVFDTVTTGASNDIEEATKLAKAMVTQFGMSKKFGVMGLATKRDIYLSNESVLNCGDKTAAMVDDEIKRMLDEAYSQAKKLLTKHKKALDELANYLIEKETITGKEFMEIFTRITGIVPEEKSRIEEIKQDSKGSKVGNSKSHAKKVKTELENENDVTKI